MVGGRDALYALGRLGCLFGKLQVMADKARLVKAALLLKLSRLYREVRLVMVAASLWRRRAR